MRIFILLKEVESLEHRTFKPGYKIFCEDGICHLGSEWDMPVEILERNPNWFMEEITEDRRLELIRVEFIKLKEAHDWCKSHFPDELTGANPDILADRTFLNETLLPAVDKIYDKLEKLGVSKEFSAALFILGGVVDNAAVEQFKK